MTPASLGLPHEPPDSPTFDSIEIAELDDTCVERREWKTSERTGEDHGPSLLELNGVNVRSQPVYVAYHPGAPLLR